MTGCKDFHHSSDFGHNLEVMDDNLKNFVTIV